MKQATIWLARNLVLLTVVTVVAAVTIPTPSAATEHEGMTQMVQAAKTAADHEALATQYDKRATRRKPWPPSTGRWVTPTRVSRPSPATRRLG
jgi:hypothetical protein